MTGAIHGSWCNAVTWNTKCPRCNDPVFFFHYNCGSKVFSTASDILGRYTTAIPPGREISLATATALAGLPLKLLRESRSSERQRDQSILTSLLGLNSEPGNRTLLSPFLLFILVTRSQRDGCSPENERVQVDVAQALKFDGTSVMLSGFPGATW